MNLEHLEDTLFNVEPISLLVQRLQAFSELLVFRVVLLVHYLKRGFDLFTLFDFFFHLLAGHSELVAKTFDLLRHGMIRDPVILVAFVEVHGARKLILPIQFALCLTVNHKLL